MFNLIKDDFDDNIEDIMKSINKILDEDNITDNKNEKDIKNNK